MNKTIRLGLIFDGRRGHENQVLGLAEAFGRRAQVHIKELPLLSKGACLPLMLGYNTQEKMDFIIAAGHRSQLNLLARARQFDAPSVHLMKPGLPRSLFSYCIIPKHDGTSENSNTLQSEGVLNRVTPGNKKTPPLGLILLGGPSGEFDWNQEMIRQQCARIITAQPNVEWHIADSRRTPDNSLADVSCYVEAETHPFASSADDWLKNILPTCSYCWVSPDSASMVYECLSSGAITGILELPNRKRGRVSRGLEQLIKNKMLRTVADINNNTTGVSRRTLAEADRACEWLLLKEGLL